MRSPLQTLWYRLRRPVYLSYFRLAHANYDARWFATCKRTPGGTFRSYELYNRHGRDAMLAELADACGPTDTVYDVGANVGVYSLALASAWPDRHVVAFEPAPSTAQRLRANVELNDLHEQIDVCECGVGTVSGESPFYCSSYSELSAFDRESATRWEATIEDVVTVPIRRLDDLEDHPPPDVVKIDVEGGAPAVLRGARKTLATHQPLVFVELHTDGLSEDLPATIRSILGEADYTIHEREDYWRCEPLEGTATPDSTGTCERTDERP